MSNDIASIEHALAKVAGVNHPNGDGNPVDPNAVAVVRATGEQIGYLSSYLAKRMVPDWQEGYQFEGYIEDIMPEDMRFPFLGVRLIVVRTELGTDPKEVRRYIKRLVRGGC